MGLSDRWKRSLARPAEGVGASLWWPALAAGSLWLAMGLSAGFWGLRLWAAAPLAPLPAAPLPLVQFSAESVGRALGERPSAGAEDEGPAPVTMASRLRLLGVVAQGGAQGVALIAMDSQPPRPYVVGAAVAEGLVLQAIGRKTARLGPASGASTGFELSLPQAPAQTASASAP